MSALLYIKIKFCLQNKVSQRAFNFTPISPQREKKCQDIISYKVKETGREENMKNINQFSEDERQQDLASPAFPEQKSL